MMDVRFAHEAVFRWIHIVAGIVWIGHLYFFNFVNGPFAGTMDPDTRKKVEPQLIPRALYWFRWGAAWTWVTGVLLVLLIFYHGREVFPGIRGFALPDIVMILVTFLAFLGYDALWKSGLGKDIRGRTLTPQRLHVGAARLDHDQLPHDDTLRIEPRVSARRDPGRLGRRLPPLREGPQSPRLLAAEANSGGCLLSAASPRSARPERAKRASTARGPRISHQRVRLRPRRRA